MPILRNMLMRMDGNRMNKRQAKKRIKLVMDKAFDEAMRSWGVNTEICKWVSLIEPHRPYPASTRVTATEVSSFNAELGLVVKDWRYITRFIYSGKDDLMKGVAHFSPKLRNIDN